MVEYKKLTRFEIHKKYNNMIKISYYIDKNEYKQYNYIGG